MNKLFSLLLTLSLSTLLLSCGSNSTDADHDHGEPPEGVQLLSSGSVIATQDGTEVTYPSGTSIPLVLSETIEVEVQFMHHDGDILEYHADEGYSLEFQNKNSDVIEIELHDHAVLLDESHEFMLEITGVGAGTATFAVQLMHAGHSDFLSRDFTVTVTE